VVVGVGNDTSDTIRCSSIEGAMGPTPAVRSATTTHNKYKRNAWMAIETKTATHKNKDGRLVNIDGLKGCNCGHILASVHTAQLERSDEFEK
jgi:hypothetical protein